MLSTLLSCLWFSVNASEEGGGCLGVIYLRWRRGRCSSETPSPSTWFIWFTARGVGVLVKQVCVCCVFVYMCVCRWRGGSTYSSADVYIDLSSSPFISTVSTGYEYILLLLGRLFLSVPLPPLRCVLSSNTFDQHVNADAKSKIKGRLNDIEHSNGAKCQTCYFEQNSNNIFRVCLLEMFTKI